jgi:hypothetical protein
MPYQQRRRIVMAVDSEGREIIEPVPLSGEPAGVMPPATPTPPAASAIDINTAVYPDSPEVPEALRGKPIRDGVKKLIETFTEKEQLRSALSEKERALQEFSQPARREESPEEAKRREEEAFIKDPTTYMKRQFDERIAPLAERYLKDSESNAESSARTRLEHFDKYSDEMKGYVSKVAPEYRGLPDTWDLAYKLARYKDLEKMEKEMKAREGYYVEAGGGGVPPQSQAKVKLSEEEKATAREFGMTEEDYIKWSSPTSGIEN